MRVDWLVAAFVVCANAVPVAEPVAAAPAGYGPQTVTVTANAQPATKTVTSTKKSSTSTKKSTVTVGPVATSRKTTSTKKSSTSTKKTSTSTKKTSTSTKKSSSTADAVATSTKKSTTSTKKSTTSTKATSTSTKKSTTSSKTTSTSTKKSTTSTKATSTSTKKSTSTADAVATSTSTKKSTTSTSTKATSTSTSTKKSTTSTKTSTTVGTPLTTSKTTSTSKTSTSTTSTTSAKPTTLEQIVVYHHNLHRSNHSAVNIKWSSSLASTAAKIASTCVYQHNTTADGGGYGQNIAAGVKADNISSVITELFYNGEEPYFNGLYGESQPSYDNFAHWGHFSQIVWKDTTTVGCAVQYCSGGLTNAGSGIAPYFTVCNYEPAGNYGGEYADNIGEPLGDAIAHWNTGL